MARIEGLRIKNFRVLKDITLGKLWNTPDAAPLTPMTAVIGKNGVGKSTLFDAFGFLSDCLGEGVEAACWARNRNGFHNIRSKGQDGPILFDVCYREDGDAVPIIYGLCVDLDESKRPYVRLECLSQFPEIIEDGRLPYFFFLQKGKGFTFKNDKTIPSEERAKELKKAIDAIKKSKIPEEEFKTIKFVELDDNRRLGIATLGELKEHPRIAAFRRFIESWHLSYFSPDAARKMPMSGPQKHLNPDGSNLGNVVQYMAREHKERFNAILERIAAKIPGIHRIDTDTTQDGRLLLRFNDRGFVDPFYAYEMSDGTLKMFAYLLLLEDPSPPSFLCIEEPENGLYHKLLEALATAFQEHAKHEGGAQVFVTTHQPYFVDALAPEEVWILKKGEDGFATIHRASDDPLVKNLVEEGLPLGGLWYSDYLDER